MKKQILKTDTQNSFTRRSEEPKIYNASRLRVFALKILTLCACAVIFASPAFAAEKEKDTAYDRIMKTQTIRCGYFVGAPYFMKDPATGAMSGIWYEYVEEMGKKLGLKIDWAEEVGLGDIATALDSGRIDAFCVGLWVSPERARVMDFTTPISYQVVHAYTRADDTRFNGDLSRANTPDITISCLDGEMAAAIAAEDLPQARLSCLPQLSPFSDMLMNVVNNKADLTFASPAAAESFNKNNPPGIKKVELTYPVRIFGESLPIARRNDDLRRMLDHVTGFLLNSGKIEQILKKYETRPGAFQRVAKPYEAPR